VADLLDGDAAGVPTGGGCGVRAHDADTNTPSATPSATAATAQRRPGVAPDPAAACPRIAPP
jgi:hypothetical protein